MLCVNNLSRFPQPIELNLQHWNGYTPVEMTGYVDFPRIGQLPVSAHASRSRVLLVPVAPTRARRPAVNLPFDEWIATQRWYAGRNRELSSVKPAVDGVAARGPRPRAARRLLHRRTRRSAIRCSSGGTPAPSRSTPTSRRSARTVTAPPTTRSTTRPPRSTFCRLSTRRQPSAKCASAKEPGADVARSTSRPRVSSAEQSNTSVMFEEQADPQGVPPDHRRHQPGHRAEPRAGARGQPARRAAARCLSRRRSTASRTRSGMVTEFAANSAEGWDMATASTRDLFAEGDLYADEVGGDFAGESYRLGEAVASVHATLAEEARHLDDAVPDRHRARAAVRPPRRRCPTCSSTSR